MASYNPPNPYVPNAFNPNQYITPSSSITTQYLDENYLRFPFAQGAENFVSINNQGQLNQGGKAEFSSATIPVNFLLAPTITNPIADTATTPTNAVATIGYVLANEQGGSDLLPKKNLWTGVNNFNPTPLQTNGATMTKGLTLTNNQISVGGDGDNDIVSYTPNTTSGLCMYSLGLYDNCIGKSPQIQLFPDGVESLIQAQASNGKVVLSATGQGGSIELNASAGVKVGVNGVLNFNNWGTLTGSSTTNGILSSVALNLPAQTTYNPSISYGNVASTQQFVQLALASQGAGDASQSGNNNFTGFNTFNVNPPTSTINQVSTNTTQFATIGYVNGIVSTNYPTNALSNGTYIGSGGAGTTNTSNVTGSITGNYIGVNTILVFPTTITCTASIEQGGDASETITFDLARALAPNNLTSSNLTGLSATITPASTGQMKGCQLIAGYNAVDQVYTLSAFVNQNNYFDNTDNYTLNFSGYINYVPT